MSKKILIIGGGRPIGKTHEMNKLIEEMKSKDPDLIIVTPEELEKMKENNELTGEALGLARDEPTSIPSLEQFMPKELYYKPPQTRKDRRKNNRKKKKRK